MRLHDTGGAAAAAPGVPSAMRGPCRCAHRPPITLRQAPITTGSAAVVPSFSVQGCGAGYAWGPCSAARCRGRPCSSPGCTRGVAAPQRVVAVSAAVACARPGTAEPSGRFGSSDWRHQMAANNSHLCRAAGSALAAACWPGARLTLHVQLRTFILSPLYVFISLARSLTRLVTTHEKRQHTPSAAPPSAPSRAPAPVPSA